MKLTQTQALEALKLAGVSAAEIVDNEADSEYDADTVLEQVDASRGAIITPKVRAEMKTDLEKSIGGMIGKKLQQHLKKVTGFTSFTDGMTDDEKITAALDHFVSNHDKNKGDAQEAINKLIAAHTSELESVKTDLTTKLTASEQRFADRDLMDYFRKKVNALPIQEAADKEFYADLLFNRAKTLGIVKLEGDKANYFKADNPELPLMNAKENDVFDDTVWAKDLLTKAGVIKTDMRHNAPNLNGGTQQASTPMPGNVANGRAKDSGESFFESVKNFTKSQLENTGGTKV